MGFIAHFKRSFWGRLPWFEPPIVNPSCVQRPLVLRCSHFKKIIFKKPVKNSDLDFL